MICKLIPVLLRGLHAHQLHIGHGQQDGYQARSHGRDLRAHEVGQGEHHASGGDSGEGQVGYDALEALTTEGHGHHNKRDDEHAEHVDAAYHGGVESHGADARVGEGRAAVDGGQARAAPGAGRGVAQQGQGDGGHRVKAQSHQERRSDGGRGACPGGALQENGEHHAHDDHLYPAVVADAGDGALHLVDSAGVPQEVQDHKCAEDHEYDLQALLDALPDQRVVHGNVLLKGCAGDVEVCKGQHQCPDQSHRRDFFGRLVKTEDTHQHHDDGAECHYKI